MAFFLMGSKETVKRRRYLRNARTSIGQTFQKEDDRVRAMLCVMAGCLEPAPETFALQPNAEPPKLYFKMMERIREHEYLKPDLPLLILIWIEEERYPSNENEEDCLLQTTSRGLQLPPFTTILPFTRMRD